MRKMLVILQPKCLLLQIDGTSFSYKKIFDSYKSLQRENVASFSLLLRVSMVFIRTKHAILFPKEIVEVCILISC